MIDAMLFVKSNPMLYSYLKYHSYWYKSLYRNPFLLKEMINDMKVEYKLTTQDKIEEIGKRIQMVSSLLSVLR